MSLPLSTTFAHGQSHRARAALAAFHATTLDALLAAHERDDPFEEALALFHEVAASVPAYAAFLGEHGVEWTRVTSRSDFERLPTPTKDTYYRRHPLPALCRGGRLEDSDFVAVSSGSTGEPAVWPRFVSDELGSAERFEQVLADAFQARERRTLGVVCFALGSWVGGMYTTAACRHVAAKGYPLTLVTPGNNVVEILRVVRALAPYFEQTVLFGYPPFLKDVIDAGRADALDWGAQPVRLVTAGEVFSEAWRDLVVERAGGSDPARSTASLYGTADGGVLANETPLSITIRRLLAEHPSAARELFGEPRLPTLCQYNPLHRYFEVDDRDLLFTGDGGAPLVRYRILDRGGVVEYERMLAFCRDHGFDPLAALGETPARALPFVFVFGRTGFAVSYYGANVYPENVAPALEAPLVAPHVTGKFVLELTERADGDTTLRVSVELAPGREPREELARSAARAIEAEILRQNSEYRSYVPEARRTPEVRLMPNADPSYFPKGVKHRYAR
ncbi:MAG TPA: phenylacetate--CoA ligase family protein [Polyangiaceae bacterium]|nr:phenylacetate--CoA ligase family protein [Polyangiaceae bacterium]